MDANQTHELFRRIERLERAHRWQRRCSAILGALLGLAVIGALHTGAVSSQPRVIEGERLIVRDTAGTIRGELSVGVQGETTFNLHDDRGGPIISMGGAGGFAGFTMLDAAGRERVFIQLGPDHLGNDRGPRFGLLDTGGTIIWSAP